MQNLRNALLAAAERGNPNAQFNLGMMLENRATAEGYAIERGDAASHHAEALKWLLSAAEQDLPRAQLQLAEAYAGDGKRPDDYVKAAGWFLVATTKLSGVHRHRAQTGYQLVRSRLTPAQITKAMRFAAAWKPKPWGGVSVISP